MIEKFDSFLGKGWHFPPTFDKYSKTVQMVEGDVDIIESLGILLSTAPGERVMLPDYGADMQRLLFEPLNVQLTTYMKDIIKTAIILHEPRIKMNDVILTMIPYEGRIDIQVDYVVVTTNTRYNNVFPYYINEANNL